MVLAILRTVSFKSLYPVQYPVQYSLTNNNNTSQRLSPTTFYFFSSGELSAQILCTQNRYTEMRPTEIAILVPHNVGLCTRKLVKLTFFCRPSLRPTAMGPQKYKNETEKNVDFRGNYVCISYFVWPRYRLGE